MSAAPPTRGPVPGVSSPGTPPLSERSLLLLLAGVQFTHIMDFMILMPLGPELMRELGLGPGEFSALVSAYTVAAGVVGLLAAPFIDRHDRRTLLLWTYLGFIAGTLACAVAHRAGTLLAARILCGAFGGVSGAMVLATVGDVVPPERRGAGIGIVMTAFSVASALGVPFGLFLAQSLRWEAPFALIALLAAVTWVLLWRYLPAVRGHLEGGGPAGFGPFLGLLRDPNALRGLLFMASLVFGHFMIIPLMSPFFVGNVGLPERSLFLVYLVGGAASVATSSRVGRLADRHGRARTFGWLVAIAGLVTLAIANSPRLGPAAATAWVLLLAALFFIFASGRFVPGQAILSLAVPPARRGAYMSLVSCVRDLAAGLTSSVGGWVVTRADSGALVGYPWLGWLGLAGGLLSIWLAGTVHPVEMHAGRSIGGKR